MRYLILLLLFAPAQLFGQSWYVKNNLDWYTQLSRSGNTPAELLRFRNASFTEKMEIPGSFFDRIPWQNGAENLRLSFYNYETEVIGEVSDFDMPLENEFKINYDLSLESGMPYLQYSVFPFRVNQGSGKVERLKNFILKVEAEGKFEKDITARKRTQDASVLGSGNWFKIRTGKSGIYKLSYSDLVSIGLSDPSKVRVYGWGGTKLPENVTDGVQDQLYPVPTYISKGTDGVFNQGDFILFYASGPVTWKFNELSGYFVHERNNYSDYGYYFLTSDMGQAVEPGDDILPTQDPQLYVTSYDFLDYHEEDLDNPIKSGKEWFGELFDLNTQLDFNFKIPGIDPGSDLVLQTSIYSRSKDTASYFLYANSQVFDTVHIRQANVGDYTATYAYSSNKVYNLDVNSENLTIRLKYNKPEPSAIGFLDYLAINARAGLNLNSNELIFRDSKSTGAGNITEFQMGGAGSNTRIWQIDDIHNIRNIPFTLAGNQAIFKYETGELHEFIAFNVNGAFPVPEYSGEGLGKVINQDLHNIGHPDLVIISPVEFMPEAERLAEFRRQYNGLDVFITDPETIYNDFSSGRPDITAIRNFMRSLYISAGEDTELKPKYLLLFGDGSYKFKNSGPEDGNFIPTYQSDNSISPTFSYVSDDYFGILDDGEGMYSGLLDIGIGRLPVKNLAEAKLLVDKIIHYESPENMGDWRNMICFIGDDEDSNIHSIQADQLARYVEEHYNLFNINKIYLDAYPQETTSKGDRYPDVTQSINDQVRRGALIVNYTGHGGTKGLAHEQILGVNDIITWDNKGKLPLFMTATCEFSRYDEPEIVSAGEEVLLNPDGGGIALLTTTRLVYSGPNHVLNERFYEIVFEKAPDGLNYCLGDIMKYSKNNAGFGINKRNFTLLGDPAMRLKYPAKSIITDSINFKSAGEYTDTLRAFENITISGHISDLNGELLSDFNGTVYPSIYDKAVLQTTLANDGGTPLNFRTRKSLLYRGKASVRDGRFNFTFIVPRDINYSIGNGRLSFYAADSIIDASGAFENMLIGGSGNGYEQDYTGPELKVYMNNRYFMENGITDENPVLYVEVYDEHGVNTTGNGIGHDITAVLNNDNSNSFVLNDFYQAELDSYKSGVIEYPFFNLDEGNYEVKVKVWDIYNNSSEGSTEFIVVKKEEMILDGLLNIPNPFTDFTEFSFEHNKSGTNLDIVIDIYNLQGELVKTIKTKQYSNGFRSEPIIWNGKDDNGTASRQGVYLYRIRVKTGEGFEAEKTGRMLIVR